MPRVGCRELRAASWECRELAIYQQIDIVMVPSRSGTDFIGHWPFRAPTGLGTGRFGHRYEIFKNLHGKADFQSAYRVKLRKILSFMNFFIICMSILFHVYIYVWVFYSEYFHVWVFILYEYFIRFRISECDNWIRTKIIQQHAENRAALFPFPAGIW